MKSKPSVYAPDALIFSRGDENTNRWTCIECETENDSVRRSCMLCGAPLQEMPAEESSAAAFARPRSSYDQPATQFHSGISEPVSTDSRPESFLRRNWLKIAALLVMLGIGAYLLIHFHSYEHTLTLSDGSRLVFSKSYGDITGAEYFDSDSTAAGELHCSEDYSKAEYAVFLSGETPVRLVYFTGSGENIAVESRRELEYGDTDSLIRSTLYDADGLTLSMEEYFPDMVFVDGKHLHTEVSAADMTSGSEPAGSQLRNPVLDNDFSHLVCSRRSEYADGRLSVIHEYDEQGRKTAQTNCNAHGKPLEILEYEYTDGGRISYRCSTDHKRLSATEPDGKYWTYHYNDNNEFVNRTRVVEYVDWDYSGERISLANYELNYIKLAEPIYSCSQFCYNFQVDTVSYGNVEGKFKIFVRNDKGRWSSVKTFSYSKKDGAFPEVGGSVQLDTPMNITGFAFLPSTAKTLSWGSYESTFNYVVLDKNY